MNTPNDNSVKAHLHAQAKTAYDFFYDDVSYWIIEENPEICQTDLDKEIEERWNKCRLTDPKKFRHYVSMSCEDMFVDKELEDIKPYTPRFVSTLVPSPSRSHDEPCFPDYRTCQNCWRYWCGKCGSGMASWIGGCCSGKK